MLLINVPTRKLLAAETKCDCLFRGLKIEITKTVYVNTYQLSYNENRPKGIIGVKEISLVASSSDPET